ncbi:hypothetical protein JOB18_009850 [Solea senegalensis]|uniref:Uncharacterized protein n=1 Tax=Solea senegalensis TaxID=28829 RepID=A0AAV6RSA8_SOLSE|nr:hypothetical protein JOB18_009850 [Solea senegalensis]
MSVTAPSSRGHHCRFIGLTGTAAGGNALTDRLTDCPSGRKPECFNDQKPWESGVFCHLCWTRFSPIPL